MECTVPNCNCKTPKSVRKTEDLVLARLRRKRVQAWDLAGAARRDGDKKDELRWTNEARDWSRQITDYLS